MRVVVIDGQGGSIGKALIEGIKAKKPEFEIIAIGTNAVATANMLKGGATVAVTGENPVIVNCRKADFILGPIGIIMADSMYGEITSAMAKAIGESSAHKILIPMNKCITVVGAKELSLSEYIAFAISSLDSLSAF